MAPPIVDEARKLAEIVIIEAPALLGYHDAAAFSPDADVVLIVGESVMTTVDQAKRTGEMLKRIGSPVLGVVFTNVHIDGRDVRVAVQRTSAAPTPRAPRSGGGAGVPDGSPVVAPAAQTESPIESPTALQFDNEVVEIAADDEPDVSGHGYTNGNGNGHANGNSTVVNATNGNGHANGNGHKNGNGNGHANGNGNGVRAVPAVTKNP